MTESCTDDQKYDLGYMTTYNTRKSQSVDLIGYEDPIIIDETINQIQTISTETSNGNNF